MTSTEMIPLGFVAWGGDTLAELMPDGSWQVTTAEFAREDPGLAADLRACYGPPTGDPAMGEYGPAILEHLAWATGGVWVYERTPMLGLVH